MRHSGKLVLALVAVLSGVFFPPQIRAETLSVGGVPAFVDSRPRVLENAAAQNPVMRIVVTDDFPPFSFVDGSGRLAGLHIELARTLCETLERLCSLQARRADRVIEAITSGEADIAIAGIAVNEATSAVLDFTHPYFRFPARFIVSGSQEVPALDRTQPVGVIAGSAHEAYLLRFFPDLLLERQGDARALHAALAAGTLRQAFTDGVEAVYFLASAQAGACCRLIDGPYFDEVYFGAGLRIAVGEGRDGLRQALNSALASATASGALADSLQRAFPLDPFAGLVLSVPR